MKKTAFFRRTPFSRHHGGGKRVSHSLPPHVPAQVTTSSRVREDDHESPAGHTAASAADARR